MPSAPEAQRRLGSALAVVALAAAVNAFFNHAPWGQVLRAFPAVYTLVFFLPFGVLVPAAHVAWTAERGRVSVRWLGAAVGWRDAGAVAAALAAGSFLALGAGTLAALGPGLHAAHRLFALLLVASTAEVLLLLGVLGNAVELATAAGPRWRASAAALAVSSLTFGLFHLTYPAPWNTPERMAVLALVWVPVALLFLVTRSLLGAAVLNTMLAGIGFARDRLDLPGTTTTGWLTALLAWLLFGLVVHRSRRWRRPR